VGEFENTEIRRIFISNRDELTEGAVRISHNVELHNLYPSPIITRMMESKNMRWAGMYIA
jgi:hypothetical protein